MSESKTYVIIGGGAAGFFCAVNAARLHPGLKVIILEKSSKLLSKVKISGGGRCNVTHACFEVSQLIKFYPRGGNFLKKTFRHFYTTDTIEWFQQRGVEIKKEDDGRMFPVTDDSHTIINCLLREAEKYSVDIRMNASVIAIQKSIEKNSFQIQLQGGKTMNADFVCIASGGFSSSVQFDWIRALGHSIEAPVPSLFTFNIPNHPIVALMGVSLPHVQVKINGTKLVQAGPMLITHWGLSGPAVLKLSAWAARELHQKNYQFSITVKWLPDWEENGLLSEFKRLRLDLANQKITNRNPFNLPARLWEYLLQESGVNLEIRWADLPAVNQNKLVKLLAGQIFDVKGKTTFKEEFVTSGGVQLHEIDPEKMQSKLQEGLYFAGEIINVDGVTGGFNFQNAWTTGWIAAHLK